MYVYEWVLIFRAQVYEWDGFWNVGLPIRTKWQTSYPPRALTISPDSLLTFLLNIQQTDSKVIRNERNKRKQHVIEPSHDKTNNVAVHPAKTQISLGGCSESSLSAWRKLGSLATYRAHSEDWSDWADAQADLNLRWAHSHFFFFFFMRRLIFNSISTFECFLACDLNSLIVSKRSYFSC